MEEKLRNQDKPVVVVACKVLQSIITERLDGASAPATYLEYGLHRYPQLMAPAIQEQLDALPEPSFVIIGYGLCGNGVVGVQAREHTLLIPKTDDCIAMFLGSYESYLQEFSASPGTYYLTKGWLESGSHPLSEYEEYVEKYGPEDADWLLDTQYQDYERLCFVAHSQKDLEEYRSEAKKVAEFGRERWGWRYDERLGSDKFVHRLVSVGLGKKTDGESEWLEENFLIVPPGQEIRQEDMLRGMV